MRLPILRRPLALFFHTISMLFKSGEESFSLLGRVVIPDELVVLAVTILGEDQVLTGMPGNRDAFLVFAWYVVVVVFHPIVRVGADLNGDWCRVGERVGISAVVVKKPQLLVVLVPVHAAQVRLALHQGDCPGRSEGGTVEVRQVQEAEVEGHDVDEAIRLVAHVEVAGVVCYRHVCQSFDSRTIGRRHGDAPRAQHEARGAANFNDLRGVFHCNVGIARERARGDGLQVVVLVVVLAKEN
mmetsp:Transcript_19537/g.74994  ORF Transcript_19537/g.74994 Transcript_19537/m.74994 type:complete len:241 (+) Transcript_19537:1122-1844(+)